MPSESSEKFDSIDMDIRINDLLDRLDILEENSAANTNSLMMNNFAKGFNNNPDTSSFDFNEFPVDNNHEVHGYIQEFYRIKQGSIPRPI